MQPGVSLPAFVYLGLLWFYNGDNRNPISEGIPRIKGAKYSVDYILLEGDSDVTIPVPVIYEGSTPRGDRWGVEEAGREVGGSMQQGWASGRACGGL